MGVEGDKKKPIPKEPPEGFIEIYRRRHGDRLYQSFEPIQQNQKQEERKEVNKQ